MSNFERFIKEIYNIWCKPKSDFRAILFSPRHDFDEIDDIENNFIFTTPNRLYLYSRSNKKEIQIYDYQLEKYRIKDNVIILKLKNENKEIGFEL